MLSTIFTYEWKKFSRSKGLLGAMFVFFAIGLFSLQQGKAIYQFQQISIDSATVKKVRNYQKVKSIFDTLTYNTKQRSSIEQAFMIEWRLGDVVSKNPSPVSILSIGQSDIYSPLLSGHFNKDIFKNDFTEFQNQEKLLAGNLDVSFYILFLFPLLLLALSYNVQSADKEAGISPLLNTQANAPGKIIHLRLLFRWLMALVPVLLISLVSYIYMSSLPNFSIVSFFQWWGIALLYAIFWLVVVAIIQRFCFSSLISAITLAGIWVLLLVAIPGLLNTWFNYQYPSNNKTAIAEYRDYDNIAWDKPMSSHKKFLFSNYPQLQKDSAKLDSNNIRSFSYSLQVFNREQELYTSIAKNKKEQAASEENSFWINPVGGVMRSFAIICNSSLQQQQQFEQSVLDYRLQKLQHIYENQLLQPHFTKQDFEALPKYKAPIQNNKYFHFLFPLLVLGLVLGISGSAISLQKNKNNNV